MAAQTDATEVQHATFEIAVAVVEQLLYLSFLATGWGACVILFGLVQKLRSETRICRWEVPVAVRRHRHLNLEGHAAQSIAAAELPDFNAAFGSQTRAAFADIPKN